MKTAAVKEKMTSSNFQFIKRAQNSIQGFNQLIMHKYQNLEVSSFQLLVLAKDSRFNLKNRILISFPYDKFFRRNTATLCCEFRTDRERSRRKKKPS